MQYDVAIIGAGVIGGAVAWALAKYKLDIIVLERNLDICEGASKANSGIIHAGFDAKVGSLKARYNIQGNRMFPSLARDLDIDFKKTGSLVVASREQDLPKLSELYERGRQNNVREIGIIYKDELRLKEPNISPNAVAAIEAVDSYIVCPFTYNIALCENANENSVDFALGKKVLSISKDDGLFSISTEDNDNIRAKIVINCAGLYSDVIHNLVCPDKIQIRPRKGQYLVLDKIGDFARRTVFPLPTEKGKGILVTPTVHGNTLLGPTAEDIDDKEDTSTNREGLDMIRSGAGELFENIPFERVITSYSGLRSRLVGSQMGDFIIKESEYVPGFIDCAGIDSPGLSAAPAIALAVKDIVGTIVPLNKKNVYKKKRKGITRMAKLGVISYTHMVHRDGDFGKIICKCNGVSLAEIKQALQRPIPASSIDGIKRRTFAFMGRCQGACCISEIARIVKEIRNIDILEESLNKSKEALKTPAAKLIKDFKSGK